MSMFAFKLTCIVSVIAFSVGPWSNYVCANEYSEPHLFQIGKNSASTTVGISNIESESVVIGRKGQVKVVVTISVSGDSKVVEGAEIDLEFRQISTDAELNIESRKDELTPGSPAGNVLLSINKYKKEFKATFLVSAKRENAFKGKVKFKADIKSISDASGNRLDLPVDLENSEPNVALDPKFLEYSMEIQ